jgi:beta-glucosidase
VTALEGIRARAGNGVEVRYSPNDAEVARGADVAIVCVGNHPTCDAGWAKTSSPNEGKEAVDRQGITLEAEGLIKQVQAINPSTVVVLISSFPYAINWTAQHVPAIVHMTNNSQELGNALADVLFGDVNPAGRLVQTWVRSIDDLPPILDYDLRRGRTYMYFQGQPLFPFGHGLSYTSFSYANLKTSTPSLRRESEIQITFDLTNTGPHDGEEVVQLYVRHTNSAVERPLKELKAFQRVMIARGQTTEVRLALRAEQLSYWDVSQQRFVVEPDEVELLVGASSSDVRLTKTIDVLE